MHGYTVFTRSWLKRQVSQISPWTLPLKIKTIYKTKIQGKEPATVRLFTTNQNESSCLEYLWLPSTGIILLFLSKGFYSVSLSALSHLSEFLLSSPINTHYTDSGVYSAIFIIYLQYKTKNGAMNQSTNSLLYYCFCTLYVLCGFVFVLDLVNNTLQVSKNFIRNNNFFSCY